MKQLLKKRFVFIVRSMLWSVLLYAILMLALNWDDVSNKVRGTNPVTVMSNIPQTPTKNDPVTIPASISHKAGIIQTIITFAKDINGIVRITY